MKIRKKIIPTDRSPHFFLGGRNEKGPGWSVARAPPIPLIVPNHAEGAPGPSLLGTGDIDSPNRLSNSSCQAVLQKITLPRRTIGTVNL
jgi:hypothetical protein